jgi:DNA mismatch repair protein MutS
MRQVADIVIMAQAGSFVPAKSARMGVVDKIFTRVGASDFLARGQSTFMVEMLETANILNNATKNSLILLDEVGRGTSTFDGVSIAWAITEYIHDKIGAKTLFATHYYELTEIADMLKGVKNYSVQVKEYGDKIVFLRKIIKGSTDRSYGIHVGSLAGLPQEVIMRAEVILKSLEEANYTKDGKPKIGAGAAEIDKTGQLDLFGFTDDKLRKELQSIDVDGLTPLEALVKLKNLKDKFGL